MGNQSCKIDNGEGEKSWWPWSECKLKSCNSGYIEEGGACVRVRPEPQAQPKAVEEPAWGSVESWGPCTRNIQCRSPDTCLSPNTNLGSRCLQVDECVKAADEDDSDENNCYGQVLRSG
jgi:hypothetical protein